MKQTSGSSLVAVVDTLTLLTALGHFSVGGMGRSKRSRGFRFKSLFLSYVIPQRDVFFLLPPSGLCFLLSLKDQTSKKRLSLPLISGKTFPVFLSQIPFVSSFLKPQVNSSFLPQQPQKQRAPEVGQELLGSALPPGLPGAGGLGAAAVMAGGMRSAPATLFFCGKSPQGTHWHVGRGGEKGSSAWLYLP